MTPSDSILPEGMENNPVPFKNLLLIKGYVTGKNNFWMYLLGLLAALLGYVGFQTVILFPLIAVARNRGIGLDQIAADGNILFNPDAMGMNRNLMLTLMMGMFVFALLFFWLFVKLIQKKSLSSIVSGFERFRWKRYFFAFGVWGTLLVAFTVASYVVSPESLELRFDAPKFFMLLVVSVVFIPIQTAMEEILFRGYLMQGLSQINLGVFSRKFFCNGIFPLIVTSILFGLMHGSNPEVKAHGMLLMMPYFILFGAFLGMITLLDEGAELAMGVHFANNLFSALLVCSKNSVLQTDAIFYTNVEEPGSEVIAWAILAGTCFFIFYKTYRLSNWKLLIR